MRLARLFCTLLTSVAVLACAFLATDMGEARGAAATGGRLPLALKTGHATQVITVVAPSWSSTVATLQAWRKTSSGWVRAGRATRAHIGSDGVSKSASEYRSATPYGTFGLTYTFGYRADPGTTMPYLKTRPSDWWISEAGSLYNTHQRCSSNCAFTQGDPNEHLYYIRPYYAYAALINYNTRNSSTGVVQGKGSAFFLHVTDGTPTAGCVAIAQDRLVNILKWLKPGNHPRILIGVA